MFKYFNYNIIIHRLQKIKLCKTSFPNNSHTCLFDIEGYNKRQKQITVNEICYHISKMSDAKYYISENVEHFTKSRKFSSKLKYSNILQQTDKLDYQKIVNYVLGINNKLSYTSRLDCRNYVMD